MTTYFAFAEMLRPHIQDSRLKLPDNLETFDPNEYPHFYVFKILHQAVPIETSSLEDNANIIADLTEDEIRTATIQDLVNKGLYIEQSRDIV